MLQQTRIAQAVPYFERFVRRFPTVARLAAASEEDVLKAWEGAGYYARARNLHRAAQIIVHDRSGRIPGTVDELSELPGIGPYMAAAIASQAFGAPVVALDANGLRVVARWTVERGDPRSPPVRRRLSESVRGAVPAGESGDFNEALMELGETICQPRRPRCGECPVAHLCLAVRTVPDPGTIPRRAGHAPKPTIEAAVIGVQRRGRWLVQKRRSAGLLGGLWELPGGKLLAGERPELAAERELREETGLRAGPLVSAGVIRHEYSHFRVRLHLFSAPSATGRLRPYRGRRWVTDAEFERLPRPTATRRAMERLRALPVDRREHLSRIE